VRAAPGALGNRAEALMRAPDPILPDGHGEAEDFLDNDGITDEPLPIRSRWTIDGDRMVLDFEGTAPVRRAGQHRALPRRSPPAYVALKHIFPDLPANAGVLRPIEVRRARGIAPRGRRPSRSAAIPRRSCG
jgi:N-methylhydantoinase B